MRTPSGALVVDAAILVAATRGRGGPILAVAGRLALFATDRAFEESSRRIALGMKRPELLPTLDALADFIRVVPVTQVSDLSLAQLTLRDAVTSRNGSIDEAHILALAWAVDGDIWSTDRDFAGTGIAVWSTPNLLRALRNAA